MDAENNNVVYDAENAPAPELVEESLNKDDVVYDFQDEINKTAEKNGVDPVQKNLNQLVIQMRMVIFWKNRRMYSLMVYKMVNLFLIIGVLYALCLRKQSVD